MPAHQGRPQGVEFQAIQEYRVWRGREIPVEEVDQGGLSRAHGAEQPHDLPGPHLEGQVFQHGLTWIVRIGEGEPVHPQTLNQRLPQGRARFGIGFGDPGLGVEDGLQAGKRGAAPLQHEHHESHPHQRGNQHGQVEHIGHESAHGHLLSHHHYPAHQHQHHLEPVGNVSEDGHEEGAHVGHADGAVPDITGECGGLFSRPAEGPEGFENVDPVVGFHREIG